MLLRGLRSFERRPDEHTNTLEFSANDRFLYVGTRGKEWLKVIDINGKVGYVPKVIVQPDEYCEDRDQILSFLMDAVVKAKQNRMASASNLENLKENLIENPRMIRERAEHLRTLFQEDSSPYRDESNDGKKFVQAKRSLSEHQSTNKYKNLNQRKPNGFRTERHEFRRAGSESELEIGCYHEMKEHQQPRLPPQPPHTKHNTQSRCDYVYETCEFDTASSVKTALEGEDFRQETPHRQCHFDSDSLPHHAPSPSLQAIRSSLVNVVQETTGLDPIVSEKVLSGVFQCIKESKNSIAVPVESLLEKLSLSSISSPTTPNKIIKALEQTMNSLANFNKAKIRSTMERTERSREKSSNISFTREQQHEFVEQIVKLRKLFVECDPAHVRQLLQLGHHSFSQDFAHLYDLGSPESIKERMLDIFLIICKLDKKGRGVLLATTLPLFLARDLMAQIGIGKNERKLFTMLVDVLVYLFSCGQRMPETHFEIIGTGFFNFILKEVEELYAKLRRNESKQDDKKLDAANNKRLCSMMNLIFAYNLQFTNHLNENLVLKVISEQRRRPQALFITLIELFQKGRDLLKYIHDDDDDDSRFFKPLPHSTFKLIFDICSCQQTYAIFTSGERNLLMEIIADGLFSNPAGSTRLGYVKVLEALLSANHPQECNLRDVRTALVNVLLDADPLAYDEHVEIRRISKDFPALFIRSISKAKISDTMMVMRKDGGEHTHVEDQCNNINDPKNDFGDYLYISS